MNDESLLDDLKAKQYAEEKIDSLRQTGITTYSHLLTVIGDPAADPKYRADLCYTLWTVHQRVDKRKVAGPLLAALQSNEPDLVWAAAGLIGVMDLKRAISPLSQLATDKKQPLKTRIGAILALGSMNDERAASVLWAIVADETDDLGPRGDSLEQTINYADQSSLQRYIDLLSHSSPDLRFWAAYCLGQMRYYDISPALEALDRVVATDHTLPACWGWHVDREALLPLEWIYFRLVCADPDEMPNTYIISPAAEFATFIKAYRHWTEPWIYTTDPCPEITFRVDPSWLMEQFRQRWPDMTFNDRQPAPQAYALNFHQIISGQTVIGGLHRDGYTLILTGRVEPVCEVAVWYRSLFAPDQPLFLYEWADYGISLTSNMTVQDMRNSLQSSLNGVNC